MRASELPFQNYKSKRILSFVNLICFSVSRPKVLKKTWLRFAILSYSETLQNVIEKCFYKNRSHSKNIWKEKILRHSFVVYVLIYSVSKSEGNRKNSLWVLDLYSVRFKKTALNVSIRRIIFTSG